MKIIIYSYMDATEINYFLTGANEFIFAGTSMSDGLVGGIIIFCSLVVLCTCLILIVKVLSSVLRGKESGMK